MYLVLGLLLIEPIIRGGVSYQEKIDSKEKTNTKHTAYKFCFIIPHNQKERKQNSIFVH